MKFCVITIKEVQQANNLKGHNASKATKAKHLRALIASFRERPFLVQNSLSIRINSVSYLY